MRVGQVRTATGTSPMVKMRQPMVVGMVTMLTGGWPAFAGAGPMVKTASSMAVGKPVAGVGKVPTCVGKPARIVAELPFSKQLRAGLGGQHRRALAAAFGNECGQPIEPARLPDFIEEESSVKGSPPARVAEAAIRVAETL